MKNLLYISLLAVTISLAYSQVSFAGCGEGPPNTFTCTPAPPNPDLVGIQQGTNNNHLIIEMQDGSIIDTTAAGTKAIRTGNGNDLATLNNAEVIALDTSGIDFSSGNDTLEVNNSVIRCDGDCVEMGNDNDNMSVIGSRVESLDNEALRTGNGDDVIMVVDSEIIGGPMPGFNFGIEMGNGNDQITIINSFVTGFSTSGNVFAVRTSDQDDIITLGTGARTEGLISCGDDFDILIFAMAVPDEQLAFLSSKIASLNPAGDSITINGLFYEWVDCELLVSELVGGGQGLVRPIPTLSEWGLIALAGVLAIISIFAIRRRKAVA